MALNVYKESEKFLMVCASAACGKDLLAEDIVMKMYKKACSGAEQCGVVWCGAW